MTDAEEINFLKTRLRYNPETGHFSWLGVPPKRTSKTGHAGSIAPNGYVRISVNGKGYLAHRLAVAFATGSWPPEHTDHINGIKDDNRLCNLRIASFSQNGCNRKRRRDSKSGVKGVSWCCQTRKWKACIQVNGSERTLGRYSTIDEAASVYAHHARMLHGEFARYDPIGG